VSFDRRVSLLNDIVENCERIAGYVRGFNRVAFERDRRTHDAVERCLERICEAAIRLGDDAVALMPDQPWSEIRGTGNWLRHAYDKVDAAMIWETVERDLPELAEAARTARDQLER
jgi:uncharacterized protein with HEPN domain